jgi:diadenosine tetraphosphatase ApaH/serine/threonine PP2A family protein phosphatase
VIAWVSPNWVSAFMPTSENPSHPRSPLTLRPKDRAVKRALISDIHSNLEGFQAVLADIDQQGITEIYCLGDVIGYGPNPCECIDLVMKCDFCILGNHDQGALFDPEGFNSGAERAIFWTRDQLENPKGDHEANTRRWDFLGELPRNRRENGFLFVHGSARNPLNEYVFPEDVYNQRKMEKIFSLIERHCFQGHTHVPGVFTEELRFFSPEDINYTYELTDQKTMVNVGSVGQPRDGDSRACYVVLEDERIEFRRVEYPIDTTAQKIYDTPELDNFLGDRLKEGR